MSLWRFEFWIIFIVPWKIKIYALMQFSIISRVIHQCHHYHSMWNWKAYSYHCHNNVQNWKKMYCAFFFRLINFAMKFRSIFIIFEIESSNWSNLQMMFIVQPIKEERKYYHETRFHKCCIKFMLRLYPCSFICRRRT